MTDAQTMDEAPDKPRTIRAPDEIWSPFLQLAQAAEKLSGSDVIRRQMQAYLKEYRVFWAPEHKDIDPAEKHVAWYECDECNDVHRLSGRGAPWGCSVLKAHQDRLDKENAK